MVAALGALVLAALVGIVGVVLALPPRLLGFLRALHPIRPLIRRRPTALILTRVLVTRPSALRRLCSTRSMLVQVLDMALRTLPLTSLVISLLQPCLRFRSPLRKIRLRRLLKITGFSPGSTFRWATTRWVTWAMSRKLLDVLSSTLPKMTLLVVWLLRVMWTRVRQHDPALHDWLLLGSTTAQLLVWLCGTTAIPRIGLVLGRRQVTRVRFDLRIVARCPLPLSTIRSWCLGLK